MKMKKYKGYVVYGFIISLFFFGCMNLKTHRHVDKAKSYKDLEVQRQFRVGANNFVFLTKQMEFIFQDDCKEKPILCEEFIGSTASGIVLNTDRSSIVVLTAAHFCAKDRDQFMFREKITGIAGDVERDLFILAIDMQNDLCLLLGPKKKQDNFKNIKIADNTIIGEPVYAVAAPLGISGSGIRMIFEGRLGGCSDLDCLTTIPATFGSSGAGIVNKDGELITIVMAVPEEFNHVIISPSNKVLIEFIRNIDKEVDIYSY